jgi:hypothetical protein
MIESPSQLKRYRLRIVLLILLVVIFVCAFFYDLEKSAGSPGDPISELGVARVGLEN